MEGRSSLNTQQAAEYLQNRYGVPVTRGGMEVWRHYGRGPRYKKIARWVVYDKADLDRFAGGQIVETIDSLGLEAKMNRLAKS